MADTDFKGKDKILHFSACLVMAIYDTEGSILAALAKEYGDYKSPVNHFCKWDLLADGLGAACGTAIRMLISGKWHWF